MQEASVLAMRKIQENHNSSQKNLLAYWANANNVLLTDLLWRGWFKLLESGFLSPVVFASLANTNLRQRSSSPWAWNLNSSQARYIWEYFQVVGKCWFLLYQKRETRQKDSLMMPKTKMNITKLRQIISPFLMLSPLTLLVLPQRLQSCGLACSLTCYKELGEL